MPQRLAQRGIHRPQRHAQPFGGIGPAAPLHPQRDQHGALPAGQPLHDARQRHQGRPALRHGLGAGTLVDRLGQSRVRIIQR
ncbi:hypothetical protein G6F68_019291 [Rhizopus microsporus]|nr:hypothetical protein G6F68_019291 [Rhizopus microsporus]